MTYTKLYTYISLLAVVSVLLCVLQVTLIEPVIAKQKQNAPPPNPKLNAQNNIEWRLELKPEETRAIEVKYTVEFPTNKKVEGL